MNTIHSLSSQLSLGGLTSTVAAHPLASGVVITAALVAIGYAGTRCICGAGSQTARQSTQTGASSTERTIVPYTGPIDWSGGAGTTVLSIPKGVLAIVAGYLDTPDLGRCLLVNRVWLAVARKQLQDLTNDCFRLSGESMFGRAEWIAYAGDPGSIPPPSKANLQTLREWQNADAPPLLYYIPKQVGKAAWTLPALVENAKKEGNAYQVSVFKVTGDNSVPTAGWVVMQRRLIADSRGIPTERRLELVQAEQARVPKVLELATIVDAHFRRTGERLFVAGEPYACACYALCEWVDVNGAVRYAFVGGLSSSVLIVRGRWFDDIAYDGAVALR